MITKQKHRNRGIATQFVMLFIPFPGTDLHIVQCMTAHSSRVNKRCMRTPSAPVHLLHHVSSRPLPVDKKIIWYWTEKCWALSCIGQSFLLAQVALRKQWAMRSKLGVV